jgi:hypothetical protein
MKKKKKIPEVAQNFVLIFSSAAGYGLFLTKMGLVWATLWASFSQTLLELF